MDLGGISIVTDRTLRGVTLLNHWPAARCLIAYFLVVVAVALPTQALANPSFWVANSSADWEAAADLAGLNLVQTSNADAALVALGDGWQLVVRDSSGTVQRVSLDYPATQAQREEIAWLAKSLIHPVEVSPLKPVLAKPTPEARSPRVGLGAIVGGPYGLTAKVYFPNPTHAAALAAGVTWYGDQIAQASYLWRPSRITEIRGTEFFWHVGLGANYVGPNQARRKAAETTAKVMIGPRLSTGVDLTFDNQPIEVFLDVSATKWLNANVGLDLSNTAGVRYFFGPK